MVNYKHLHYFWAVVREGGGDFPLCLDGTPLLFPSSGNQLRSDIDQWLDKHRIHPRMIAEFDDSALMKAFGQECAYFSYATTGHT